MIVFDVANTIVLDKKEFVVSLTKGPYYKHRNERMNLAHQTKTEIDGAPFNIWSFLCEDNLQYP